MELWELMARESIRDIVTRYHSNGDTGRYDQVVELFAPDAVVESREGPTWTGKEEIRAFLTRAQNSARPEAEKRMFVRCFISTHQIDLIDESTATGRYYYCAVTAIGPDHWGRFVDRYRTVDGVWKFAHRLTGVDGRNPTSQYLRNET